MLWLKWLHIVFMVTWFAGLFYLPRLFVYHAMSEDAASRERFKIMGTVDLATYHGKNHVVLFFYAKDGTPCCTKEATDFSGEAFHLPVCGMFQPGCAA